MKHNIHIMCIIQIIHIIQIIQTTNIIQNIHNVCSKGAIMIFSEELESTPEMVGELTAEKEKNRLYKNNYKAVSDEHKGEVLAADIKGRTLELLKAPHKVDLNNLEEVQLCTYNYFNACAAAEVYPSVMGLATHGFKISRQALNQYMLRNPNSETTEYINRVKDIMADILTNESLKGNANPVQAIFQLKNHFEHTDRVEVAAIKETDEHSLQYYLNRVKEVCPDQYRPDMTLEEAKVALLIEEAKYLPGEESTDAFKEL